MSAHGQVSGVVSPRAVPSEAMSTLRDLCQSVLGSVRATILSWPVRKRVFAILACVFVLVITVIVDVPSLEVLQQWATSTGPWFVVVFCALYVSITQFPIPRTFLTLSSGVLFGPSWGISIALVATTISAIVSVLAIRWFLGDWMVRRLDHPSLDGINVRLRERGWLAVFSLRMIGPVPFSLLNYAVALTPISVMPFAIATLIGSTPGTIAVVLMGNSLTGDMDPKLLIVMTLFACCGLAGLIVDNKLPVKDSGNIKP